MIDANGDKRDSSILSDCYDELINKLFDFVLRNDIERESELYTVRVAGFSALYNLLQYAPRDCEKISLKFMDDVHRMLEKSIDPTCELDAKNKELQGFLL